MREEEDTIYKPAVCVLDVQDGEIVNGGYDKIVYKIGKKFGVEVSSDKYNGKTEPETREKIIEEAQKSFDMSALKRLLTAKLDGEHTIVIEHYVDKFYRDLYYSYYSGAYSEVKRDCVRLTIFSGNYDKGEDHLECFFDNKTCEDVLRKNFVGMIVLRPLKTGTLGRTLLDPRKIKIGESCHIKTTEFKVNLLGHKYTVEAFPFSSSDRKIMTCSETSLWMILEYTGTRYPENRTYLPGEILSEKRSIPKGMSMVPSRGLYPDDTFEILQRFGSSPAEYLYDKEKGKDEFKRYMHYYIESGIPVILSCPNGPLTHSKICIGHGNAIPIDTQMKELAPHKDLKYKEFAEENSLICIDSSMLFKSYVTMDSDGIPYDIESFDEWTGNSQDLPGKLYFVAPLYKKTRIMAKDVYDLFDRYIGNSQKDNSNKEYCSEDDTLATSLRGDILRTNETFLIKRIFMASSTKFKMERIDGTDNAEIKRFYSSIPFPKIICVCEISTLRGYYEKKVLGEIVLDVTAATNDSAFISSRIGGQIRYRLPNQRGEKTEKVEVEDAIKQYDGSFISIKGKKVHKRTIR